MKRTLIVLALAAAIVNTIVSALTGEWGEAAWSSIAGMWIAACWMAERATDAEREYSRMVERAWIHYERTGNGGVRRRTGLRPVDEDDQ